jgi:6-phosphogluconolactonase (cycloisomerase 2 family)
VIDRRAFLSLLAAAPSLSSLPANRSTPSETGRVQAGNGAHTALYASVGPVLTHYDVDATRAVLTRRSAVTLPVNVHYAWPHASNRYLYVASSSSAPANGPTGTDHFLHAFTIDARSGALTLHGQPIRLPTRPIHLTSDIPSRHLLVAFNNPSALRVYRLNADASLDKEVPPAAPLDFGIYGHQVRVTPDNKLAILVARGNDATVGHPEDPGALKVFHYDDGRLTQGRSVAPGGGYGFGPRHLDFHRTEPWVYVSLERQNTLEMFTLDGEGPSPQPVFRQETLAAPGATRSRQAAGTVHVHPNGRFVYAVNRADTTIEEHGRRVFAGGENTLAVYAIDSRSGAPTPIQHVDTRGIHCRTFHIDPTGQMLVAAHIMGLPVREGGAIHDRPACLSVFRIAVDGRLQFVRKYDVEVGERTMFWMGMVAH